MGKTSVINEAIYMSARKAAEILDVSPATVRRWIWVGMVTAYKAKGINEWLLKPEDVEKARELLVPELYVPTGKSTTQKK